jgi:hypothetical protein
MGIRSKSTGPDLFNLLFGGYVSKVAQVAYLKTVESETESGIPSPLGALSFIVVRGNPSYL